MHARDRGLTSFMVFVFICQCLRMETHSRRLVCLSAGFERGLLPTLPPSFRPSFLQPFYLIALFLCRGYLSVSPFLFCVCQGQTEGVCRIEAEKHQTEGADGAFDSAQ